MKIEGRFEGLNSPPHAVVVHTVKKKKHMRNRGDSGEVSKNVIACPNYFTAVIIAAALNKYFDIEEA
jgi:hypothetical protein